MHFIKLGTLGTIVGIIAGLLSAAYTCTNLYEKYRIRNITGDTHVSLSGKTPLIAQTIEVHPDSAMAVRVDVSYKIYDTGDIVVESGKSVRLLPFDLSLQQTLADLLISTAYAQEQTVNGAQYKVMTIQYIESSRKLPDETLEETKTYGDGIQEVKVVDPRSGVIIKNIVNEIKLTSQQKQKIK